MEKDFKDSTVGKLIDRFANSGEIGVMDHKVSTQSILIMGAVVLAVGIALMALKKFVFK